MGQKLSSQLNRYHKVKADDDGDDDGDGAQASGFADDSALRVPGDANPGDEGDESIGDAALSLEIEGGADHGDQFLYTVPVVDGAYWTAEYCSWPQPGSWDLVKRDAATGAEAQRLRRVPITWPVTVATHAARVAAVSHTISLRDNMVCLWTGCDDVAPTMALYLTPHGSCRIVAIDFDSAGSLVTFGEDGAVCITDAESGEVRQRELVDRGCAIVGGCVVRSKNAIVATLANGQCHVLSREDSCQSAKYSRGRVADVGCDVMAMAPIESLGAVALTTAGKSLRVLHIEDMRLQCSFPHTFVAMREWGGEDVAMEVSGITGLFVCDTSVVEITPRQCVETVLLAGARSVVRDGRGIECPLPGACLCVRASIQSVRQ